MIVAEKAVKDLVTAIDVGIEKIQLERFRLQIVKSMDLKSVTPFDKSLFTVIFTVFFSEILNILFIL